MELSISIQVFDKARCISHIANTFEKGMNPIYLPKL